MQISILLAATLAVTGALIANGGRSVIFGILVGYVLIGSGRIIVRSFLGMQGLPALLLAPLASCVPIIIVGSVIYAIYSLTLPIIIALFWLPPLTALVASRRCAPLLDFLDTTRPSPRSLLFSALISILLASQGTVLFLSQTTDSRLGPWDDISPVLFLFSFLSSLLLITWFAVEKQLTVWQLLALCGQFFVSFSVALIRFPLTFGFDPILHQAAERLVLEHGTVTPKTFYYIGQYVLVPLLSRITQVPVELFDQFFLPVLFALSVPPLLLVALSRFKKTLPAASSAFILAPLFLALPFPHLIMTTPWGLAYGITFLALLSSTIASLHGSLRFHIATGCLALIALAFHPLAGIPLVFFFILMHCGRSEKKLRALSMGIVSIIGAFSVPGAFWLNSHISTQGTISLRIPSFDVLSALIPSVDFLHTRFSPLLDAVYLSSGMGQWIFLLLVIVGCVLAWKDKTIPLHLARTLQACLCAGGMTLLSGILTVSAIRFDSLASFEQHDYAERLFQVTTLFLLPIVALSLTVLMKKIFARGNSIVAFVCGLVLAGALTSSFYLSYPRNDAYVPSHAYTLSKTDIAAVRAIDQDAGTEGFVVLANQVVASAAIREFGFKTYFTLPDGPVFYYPIPSGSPLVAYYTRMLRTPSRDTARDAMKSVGVSRLYFVVRDYEFRYPIIIRDGKATADAWREIDSGKAVIFTYLKR